MSKAECLCGPGYPTPLKAMQGPKEEIIYVVCIQPFGERDKKCDYLATVDVDPKSKTYCQVISRLSTGNTGDELHHSGWNACSSCFKTKKDCKSVPKRDRLVLPALNSDRIYIVDTDSNPRQPKMIKVIQSSEMRNYDCSTPHTTHCLPSNEIMISVMGDTDGNGKGDFILIDGQTLQVKGTWTNGDKIAKFGYDFWYQPYFDIMVSTEWGAPRIFKRGFEPSDILDPTIYGRSLNFFSWSKRELIQTTNLGDDGIAPLEVRFLHDPKQPQGFVGCAVNANVFRFHLENGSWITDKVIDIKPKKVSGWITDYIQGMITDILISLDDKYLYLSNWLHGDVRQYDISDPAHPKLTGQVFLGGMILSDSKLQVLEDLELKSRPDPVYIKGRRLFGSPQMLQLSLDGQRLYISSALYSPWDKQFYPESAEEGSFMVKLNVDVENGGMSLDEEFLIDFGKEPDGPVLAHEMRYPGGDCTSDIWLAEE